MVMVSASFGKPDYAYCRTCKKDLEEVQTYLRTVQTVTLPKGSDLNWDVYMPPTVSCYGCGSSTGKCFAGCSACPPSMPYPVPLQYSRIPGTSQSCFSSPGSETYCFPRTTSGNPACNCGVYTWNGVGQLMAPPTPAAALTRVAAKGTLPKHYAFVTGSSAPCHTILTGINMHCFATAYPPSSCLCNCGRYVVGDFSTP